MCSHNHGDIINFRLIIREKCKLYMTIPSSRLNFLTRSYHVNTLGEVILSWKLFSINLIYKGLVNATCTCNVYFIYNPEEYIDSVRSFKYQILCVNITEFKDKTRIGNTDSNSKYPS